jgi:pimeloyl-ACP methyl ester carboxylesterase
VSGAVRIVLVHGAGGSPLTWSLVAPLLEGPARTVTLVDHPSASHSDNVDLVREILDEADDDAVLVGHSYGGAVITDAGRHERVRALVYVAAFAPDEGEAIDDIIARHGRAEVFQTPPASAEALLMPGAADEDWRRHSWDVPQAIRAAATVGGRRPISEEIYTTPCGSPAWRRLPTWYVVAGRDKHLRPDAQRAMAERAGAAITEVGTSHSAPVADPQAVAAAIEAALAAVQE